MKIKPRQQADGTIYLFDTSDAEIYMYPTDAEPKEINKQRHYGHRKWQIPDITVLTGIFNKLKKDEFSNEVTKSFNNTALYLADDNGKPCVVDTENYISSKIKAEELKNIEFRTRPVVIVPK